MNFTYETQGAITYLVCELEAGEQLDALTLGMLTNNHIAGLAPVLYTEMNGQRFLKYNISAKISADRFFGGNLNRQRALSAFTHILDAICSADEYMIDQNCFSVIPGHVFLNVSNCETAMICLPVVNDKDINAEIAEFFKNILETASFDINEDTGYITQLLGCVSGPSFNVYSFSDLVKQLSAISVAPAVAPAPVSPAPAVSSAPSISSFDSTISIDDMPGLQTPKAEPAAASVSPVVPPVTPAAPVTPPPVTPVIAPITPTVSSAPTVKPAPQTPPVNMAVPPVNNMNPTPASAPAGLFNRPDTPAKNQPNAGFAIPGQQRPVSVPGVPVPPSPASKKEKEPKPQKAPKEPKITNDGEKKMTFFGLLANYNKENAELYKQQKQAKKEEKEKNKVNAVPVQPTPAQSIPGQTVGRMGSGNVPPINPTPSGQPFTTPVQTPAIQPVPVQNSFNETTVLSPMMAVGETTVLGAEPAVADPYLVRVKTGERISINKPVFRIGKEKSYVDYFIADNTAISRSHANLHIENGEFFVEDTNSTNHTYVNGNMIASNVKVKIANGDKIKFANEDFIFSI